MPVEPPSRRLAAFLRTVVSIAVVGLVLAGGRAAEIISAQSDATDTELAAASATVVRVGSVESGRVIELPIEVYVARVLAGEGEPRAGDAAQQALAVAIRTYAKFNAERHRRDGFNLCDSTHCQVLRTATAASRRAAAATAGQFLTYEGHPADIYYSASCGGRSANAADVWPNANYPYLRSVPDDVHDGEAAWTLDLSLRDVEEALRRAGFAGALTELTIDGHNGSGRVSRLKLRGLQPDVIGGEQFRAAIGPTTLRSTDFVMTQDDGRRVHFEGHGYGHGVGMCVIGAGRRAQRGESYRAILAQYYPGLEIARTGDTRTTRGVAPPSAPATTPTLPGTPEAPVRAAAAPSALLPRPVVTVRSGAAGAAVRTEVERVASEAYDELSRRLGRTAMPFTIQLHDTLDGFRIATGQPWWVSAVASRGAIDIAPVPALARDGLDRAVRISVAALLLDGAMDGKPAWVRVGAARYFASGELRSPVPSRLRCPADAELTLAISVAALRDAESRAEACFARAYEQSRDWTSVR